MLCNDICLMMAKLCVLSICRVGQAVLWRLVKPVNDFIIEGKKLNPIYEFMNGTN